METGVTLANERITVAVCAFRHAMLEHQIENLPLCHLKEPNFDLTSECAHFFGEI